MTTNTQTGTVVRKYTADKFAKLTLEIAGNGKYPEKVDFKTFDQSAIKDIGALGAGETVTVSYVLQSEKLSVGGAEVTETGKDGKVWPVKVPMLKITSVSAESVKDNSGAPF